MWAFFFVLLTLVFGSLASLFFIRRTLVSHVPSVRAAPRKGSSETVEWLGEFLDKLFVFLHGEFVEDLRDLLCRKVVTTLEERDYARSVRLELASLGGAVPKISAVDIVVSTSSRLVLDFELEYAGCLDMGFSADIPIISGRTLPYEVRVRDICFCAHMRLSLSSVSLADDLDKPVVVVEMMCLSEPAFSFQLHTRVGSKYSWSDCLLVPVLVRWVLRKFITKKLLFPNSIVRRLSLPRWGTVSDPLDGDEGGSTDETSFDTTSSKSSW